MRLDVLVLRIAVGVMSRRSAQALGVRLVGGEGKKHLVRGNVSWQRLTQMRRL